MHTDGLIERAQLLLRVAAALSAPELERDRANLLTWAGELLQRAAGASISEPGQQIRTPAEPTNTISVSGRAGQEIRIFRYYKGKRYDAVLEPNNDVRFNGRPMTPSAAAMDITNNNVNGWRWWKFRPSPNSPDMLIDALRSGGVK